MTRRPIRLVTAALGVVAVAVVVLPATTARAHVTVNPREAQKGGFTKLTFRVPNERDSAGTVKVEVSFPTDRPIANVSVRPLAGWTYQVEKSRITWTGGPIKPGEFEEFEVSVGPLPDDADRLVFKALQTYEGGEVVRWIDEPVAGGKEPEHPAPVLTLTGGETAEDGDADRTGVIGIVIGGLSLVVALFALARRR